MDLMLYLSYIYMCVCVCVCVFVRYIWLNYVVDNILNM